MTGRRALSSHQAQLVGALRSYRHHLEETRARLFDLAHEAERLGIQVTVILEASGIPKATFYKQKESRTGDRREWSGGADVARW